MHYADPIRSPSAVIDGRPRKFDIAIAFPPIGVRYEFEVIERDWFGRFPERTQSSTILAIRHLLSQASRKVVVAVPNSLLFSTGAEFALREDLVRQGKIEAVIAMPAGLISGVNIPFAVLILNPAGGHERIYFVNADAPRFRVNTTKARYRLNNVDDLINFIITGTESEESIRIACSEVLGNQSQLQVGRYVVPSAEKQFQAKLETARRIALGDIVTTIRPMPSASSSDNFVEVLEVGAADLPRFGYIQLLSRIAKIDPAIVTKNKQQFLQPLDIVIVVKGSVGKVGIVPTDVPPAGVGGWVAGQSSIVLRVAHKSPIDPRALVIQLRSPLGQAMLSRIVSGAAIQLIQLRELLQLQVLVPDQESMQPAIDALESEAELQRDIERLRQKQAEVAAHFWSLD